LHKDGIWISTTTDISTIMGSITNAAVVNIKNESQSAINKIDSQIGYHRKSRLPLNLLIWILEKIAQELRILDSHSFYTQVETEAGYFRRISPGLHFSKARVTLLPEYFHPSRRARIFSITGGYLCAHSLMIYPISWVSCESTAQE